MMLTTWYVFRANTTVCARSRTADVSDMMLYAIGPTVSEYTNSQRMLSAACAHREAAVCDDAETIPMSRSRMQSRISPAR